MRRLTKKIATAAVLAAAWLAMSATVSSALAAPENNPVLPASTWRGYGVDWCYRSLRVGLAHKDSLLEDGWALVDSLMTNYAVSSGVAEFDTLQWAHEVTPDTVFSYSGVAVNDSTNATLYMFDVRPGVMGGPAPGWVDEITMSVRYSAAPANAHWMVHEMPDLDDSLPSFHYRVATTDTLSITSDDSVWTEKTWTLDNPLYLESGRRYAFICDPTTNLYFALVPDQTSAVFSELWGGMGYSPSALDPRATIGVPDTTHHYDWLYQYANKGDADLKAERFNVDFLEGQYAMFEELWAADGSSVRIRDGLVVDDETLLDSLAARVIAPDSIVGSVIRLLSDSSHVSGDVRVNGILYADSIDGSTVHFLDSISLNGTTIGEWPSGGGALSDTVVAENVAGYQTLAGAEVFGLGRTWEWSCGPEPDSAWSEIELAYSGDMDPTPWIGCLADGTLIVVGQADSTEHHGHYWRIDPKTGTVSGDSITHAELKIGTYDLWAPFALGSDGNSLHGAIPAQANGVGNIHLRYDGETDSWDTVDTLPREGHSSFPVHVASDGKVSVLAEELYGDTLWLYQQHEDSTGNWTEVSSWGVPDDMRRSVSAAWDSDTTFLAYWQDVGTYEPRSVYYDGSSWGHLDTLPETGLEHTQVAYDGSNWWVITDGDPTILRKEHVDSTWTNFGSMPGNDYGMGIPLVRGVNDVLVVAGGRGGNDELFGVADTTGLLYQIRSGEEYSGLGACLDSMGNVWTAVYHEKLGGHLKLFTNAYPDAYEEQVDTRIAVKLNTYAAWNDNDDLDVFCIDPGGAISDSIAATLWVGTDSAFAAGYSDSLVVWGDIRTPASIKASEVRADSAFGDFGAFMEWYGSLSLGESGQFDEIGRLGMYARPRAELEQDTLRLFRQQAQDTVFSVTTTNRDTWSYEFMGEALFVESGDTLEFNACDVKMQVEDSNYDGTVPDSALVACEVGRWSDSTRIAKAMPQMVSTSTGSYYHWRFPRISVPGADTLSVYWYVWDDPEIEVQIHCQDGGDADTTGRYFYEYLVDQSFYEFQWGNSNDDITATFYTDSTSGADVYFNDDSARVESEYDFYAPTLTADSTDLGITDLDDDTVYWTDTLFIPATDWMEFSIKVPDRPAPHAAPHWLFDASTDEILGASRYLDESFRDTTDVVFEILWMPTTADTGTVTWELYWNTAAEGDTLPNASGGTITITDQAAETAEELQRTDPDTLADVPMSALLTLRLNRDADESGVGADDDYSDDAGFIGVLMQLLRDGAH